MHEFDNLHSDHETSFSSPRYRSHLSEVEALEDDSYELDDDEGITKEEYIEELKELEEEGTWVFFFAYRVLYGIILIPHHEI